MQFQEWWNGVYKPHARGRPASDPAAAFMLEVQYQAARAAWEAGQQMKMEELNREIREIDQEHRKHEKGKGEKPHR